MNEKPRDILLAVLSVAGIFYFVGELFWLILDGVGFNFFNLIILPKFLLIFLFGLFVWKKVKLSKDYSNFFLLFFVILFILELIFNLIQLFY